MQKIIVLFGLLIICVQLFSQDLEIKPNDDKSAKSIFHAAPVLGVNFSQVVGDFLDGYDKIGIVSGGYAQINFTPFWAIGIEALYSQKGSKGNYLDTIINSTTKYKLKLNYAEIPITIRYTDKHIHFYAGASYARLVNFKETFNEIESKFVDNKIPYKNQDISFIGGIVGLPIAKLGIDLRFQKSLTSITISGKRDSQVNKLLSLRVFYFI